MWLALVQRQILHHIFKVYSYIAIKKYRRRSSRHKCDITAAIYLLKPQNQSNIYTLYDNDQYARRSEDCSDRYEALTVFIVSPIIKLNFVV